MICIFNRLGRIFRPESLPSADTGGLRRGHSNCSLSTEPDVFDFEVPLALPVDTKVRFSGENGSYCGDAVSLCHKRLQKIRSELTERTFAHMYETGAMRRVPLQGRKNILKRLLIHGAAFNLSLILRKVLGAGTPRGFGDLHTALLTAFKSAWASFRAPGWLFRRDPDNFLRKAA
jgi:hypothetical protein